MAKIREATEHRTQKPEKLEEPPTIPKAEAEAEGAQNRKAAWKSFVGKPSDKTRVALGRNVGAESEKNAPEVEATPPWRMTDDKLRRELARIRKEVRPVKLQYSLDDTAPIVASLTQAMALRPPPSPVTALVAMGLAGMENYGRTVLKFHCTPMGAVALLRWLYKVELTPLLTDAEQIRLPTRCLTEMTPEDLEFVLSPQCPPRTDSPTWMDQVLEEPSLSPLFLARICGPVYGDLRAYALPVLEHEPRNLNVRHALRAMHKVASGLGGWSRLEMDCLLALTLRLGTIGSFQINGRSLSEARVVAEFVNGPGAPTGARVPIAELGPAVSLVRRLSALSLRENTQIEDVIQQGRALAWLFSDALEALTYVDLVMRSHRTVHDALGFSTPRRRPQWRWIEWLRSQAPKKTELIGNPACLAHVANAAALEDLASQVLQEISAQRRENESLDEVIVRKASTWDRDSLGLPLLDRVVKTESLLKKYSPGQARTYRVPQARAFVAFCERPLFGERGPNKQAQVIKYLKLACAYRLDLMDDPETAQIVLDAVRAGLSENSARMAATLMARGSPRLSYVPLVDIKCGTLVLKNVAGNRVAPYAVGKWLRNCQHLDGAAKSLASFTGQSCYASVLVLVDTEANDKVLAAAALVRTEDGLLVDSLECRAGTNKTRSAAMLWNWAQKVRKRHPEIKNIDIGRGGGTPTCLQTSTTDRDGAVVGGTPYTDAGDRASLLHCETPEELVCEVRTAKIGRVYVPAGGFVWIRGTDRLVDHKRVRNALHLHHATRRLFFERHPESGALCKAPLLLTEDCPEAKTPSTEGEAILPRPILVEMTRRRTEAAEGVTFLDGLEEAKRWLVAATQGHAVCLLSSGIHEGVAVFERNGNALRGLIFDSEVEGAPESGSAGGDTFGFAQMFQREGTACEMQFGLLGIRLQYDFSSCGGFASVAVDTFLASPGAVLDQALDGAAPGFRVLRPESVPADLLAASQTPVVRESEYRGTSKALVLPDACFEKPLFCHPYRTLGEALELNWQVFPGNDEKRGNPAASRERYLLMHWWETGERLSWAELLESLNHPPGGKDREALV